MPRQKRPVSESESDSSSSSSSSAAGKKRKIQAITANLQPKKSAPLYEKAYADFLTFCKIRNRKPNENDVLLYLHHLAEVQKLGYKTLWTRFSMIKSSIQSKLDCSIDYKKAVAYLKRQEEEGAPTKKAAIFSGDQVFAYLTHEDKSEIATISKAFFAVTYFGGLRTEEAYQLQKADLEADDLGMWVSYQPAKQRGAKKRAVFLVPKGAPFDVLQEYRGKLPAAASQCAYLWHAINYVGRGKAVGFRAQRWGINSCRQVTIAAATALKLENPTSYTSHSLRRSAATHLADKGRTPADLMRFFGWTSMTTAQQYLDRSKHMLQSLANDLSPSEPQPSDSTTMPEPAASFSPTQVAGVPCPIAPQGMIYISNIAEGAIIQIGTDAIGRQPIF